MEKTCWYISFKGKDNQASFKMSYCCLSHLQYKNKNSYVL